MQPTSENIHAFWETQAEQFGQDRRANTPDPWINRVERTAVSAILATFKRPLTILDLACANGYSTIMLQEEFPQHNFVGADFSQKMIDSARRMLGDARSPNLRNLTFEVMDMLDLSDQVNSYDVVITIRGLINLPNSEAQWAAAEQIASTLKPGGHFIAVENFHNVQERLNAARKEIGLPPLPYRWHNCWFDETEFRAKLAEHFELLDFKAITSTYYLITRLVYSKLCQMESREPDYDHPMYEIATQLPAVGDFGPVKLSHWRKS